MKNLLIALSFLRHAVSAILAHPYPMSIAASLKTKTGKLSLIIIHRRDNKISTWQKASALYSSSILPNNHASLNI